MSISVLNNIKINFQVSTAGLLLYVFIIYISPAHQIYEPK